MDPRTEPGYWDYDKVVERAEKGLVKVTFHFDDDARLFDGYQRTDAAHYELLIAEGTYVALQHWGDIDGGEAPIIVNNNTYRDVSDWEVVFVDGDD